MPLPDSILVKLSELDVPTLFCHFRGDQSSKHYDLQQRQLLMPVLLETDLLHHTYLQENHSTLEISYLDQPWQLVFLFRYKANRHIPLKKLRELLEVLQL